MARFARLVVPWVLIGSRLVFPVMFITASTLDDLLQKVFRRLLKSGTRIAPTRGPARELVGVLLELKNPRARLSRTETRGTMFSCLGELLWYLSKTNDLEFIRYYLKAYEKESEDGQTIYGGYGPRLFRMRNEINQIANVLGLLRRNPESRRAVIQLFDASDIVKDRTEVPCTCTLQFFLRRERLHMLTNMRSNDAFFGLTHDIFTFTMLHEIIARSLNARLGVYKQAVGSLHVYEDQVPAARQYLSEGWQTTVSMPAMPPGDPWLSLSTLIEAESVIRSGIEPDPAPAELDPYWADLTRLLQIYAYYQTKNKEGIERVKQDMHSEIYLTYIERRQRMPPPAPHTPEQLPLTPGGDNDRN